MNQINMRKVLKFKPSSDSLPGLKLNLSHHFNQISPFLKIKKIYFPNNWIPHHFNILLFLASQITKPLDWRNSILTLLCNVDFMFLNSNISPVPTPMNKTHIQKTNEPYFFLLVTTLAHIFSGRDSTSICTKFCKFKESDLEPTSRQMLGSLLGNFTTITN